MDPWERPILKKQKEEVGVETLGKRPQGKLCRTRGPSLSNPLSVLASNKLEHLAMRTSGARKQRPGRTMGKPGYSGCSCVWRPAFDVESHC